MSQLAGWYDALGLPVIALRGYGSQTIADQVRDDVAHDGRPAVLLYAGDYDPSGEDVERDFLARTQCWTYAERVAITAAQVTQFGLPPLPGKATDSRAATFTAVHGRLVQVEVDALDPGDLHALFDAAINRWWNPQAHAAVLQEEASDRDRLDNQ